MLITMGKFWGMLDLFSLESESLLLLLQTSFSQSTANGAAPTLLGTFPQSSCLEFEVHANLFSYQKAY